VQRPARRRGPDPGLSIRAYGDNVRLYRSVLSIAMEFARVNLQFRKVNRDGEITLVRSHQALATLRLPQPIRGGHSILSAMDLKLVTIMHLLLKGESFWGLADRMKVSGSPTKVNVYNLGFVRACKSRSTGVRTRGLPRRHRRGPIEARNKREKCDYREKSSTPTSAWPL
jgi:hypothetical protein